MDWRAVATTLRIAPRFPSAATSTTLDRRHIQDATELLRLWRRGDGSAHLQTPVRAADPKVRTFGAAQVQEVYRVLLDRDALLLESIVDVIKEKNIQDGEVLVTAGSVEECTYHYVTSTAAKPKNAYKTVKGPFEILNAGGIIAAGEPHIHITLSSLGKGAFEI